MKNYGILIVALLGISLPMITQNGYGQELSINNSPEKTSSEAKGSLKGKIVDAKTGEFIPGASVIIEGTTIGANTDFDGNYSIYGVKPGTYTLLCKLISYSTKRIPEVVVKPHDVTIANFSLEESASQELGEVVITASLNKESINALMMMQKNNASLSDGVSAESIKRSPDKSSADVIKRVSGASIQDNKYAIIRGMSDRYNSAYINGAPLPSSESDKKAFSFDIFPSNILDNIIILKSATPELPGDFSGGIIQVNTKNIPDKNAQTISISSSYNSLTTFQEFKTYEGGKTDWLGIDDGARAIPSGIPETAKFKKLSIDEKADMAKLMTPSWKLDQVKAAPSFGLQYSLANVGNIFKKEAGSVFALTYNNSYSRNDIVRREYDDLATGAEQKMLLNDTLYANNILASALWNISYKLNGNNQLSFKNLYSINSDDKVTTRNGAREWNLPEKFWEMASVRWFTQNQLYSGQLSGDHLLPGSKIKINWIGSWSDINRSIPNMRKVVYQKIAPDVTDGTILYAALIQNDGTSPNAAGNMFFSKTTEDIYSIKYDAALPIEIKKSKHEIKIGAFHQLREREFQARSLGFSKYKKGSMIKFADTLLWLPEDKIFASENLGLIENLPGPRNGGFKLEEATKTSDSYTASSILHAGFMMIDTRIRKLRFIYGARVESYQQKLETLEGGTEKPIILDSTVVDILPSVNAVYSITDKINVRMAYFKSVARPEFRELAPFSFYDFITDFVVAGNSKLTRTLIDNYDLRFEFFPGVGQMLSVTGFYKSFINPIEMANRPDVFREVFYTNVPSAKNYGVEAEFRVNLGTLLNKDSSMFWSSSSLYANVAIIKSKVDVSGILGATSKERPLQGQSPFMANAGYQFLDREGGIGANVSYNYVGKRLYIVGSTTEPDYWENPRHVLDLQVSKTFFKKLEVKFNVKDAFSQTAYFYQEKNQNQKMDKKSDNIMIEVNYAPTYSLGLSMKF